MVRIKRSIHIAFPRYGATTRVTRLRDRVTVRFNIMVSTVPTSREIALFLRAQGLARITA